MSHDDEIVLEEEAKEERKTLKKAKIDELKKKISEHDDVVRGKTEWREVFLGFLCVSGEYDTLVSFCPWGEIEVRLRHRFLSFLFISG